MNAYLQPVMQSYLQQLDARLRQTRSGKAKASRVFVMQSSGGITSLEAASKQPVRTVLSGPAGGVIGAAAVARRAVSSASSPSTWAERRPTWLW